MKSYPSISTKFIDDKKLHIFDKLDGSNIRAEWSKKQGFYKFGSRTQLLSPENPILGPSMDVIREKEQELGQIFNDQKWDRVVTFFEYHGPNSFAGAHDMNDEMEATLIDVNVYKKGMVEPEQFIELFDSIGIPELLYAGVLTSDLIDQVKAGTLEGMSFEGVVCKTWNQKKKNVDMFKIKSREWLNKLREQCGDNEKLFQRLK